MNLTTHTQSKAEEIANSVSHGVAFIASVVAVPLLIVYSIQQGSTGGIVGASIFGGVTILLYLISSIYHALPRSRIKRVFQALDHVAIFLMIAGTYTPFTLGVLKGPWGWSILTVIWTLAIAGIVLDTNKWLGYPKLNTFMYLAMGWIILIAIKPMSLMVPVPGLAWLISGGLFYTVGVVFYTAEKVRYSHFIWHLFVVGGTTCHFFAVLWYAGG